MDSVDVSVGKDGVQAGDNRIGKGGTIDAGSVKIGKGGSAGVKMDLKPIGVTFMGIKVEAE